MKKLSDIRLWLTVALTAVLVSAGYELRSAGLNFGGVPSYLVAVVSLVLGGKLAATLVDLCTKSRWLRGKVNSTAHIEGYWYLTTTSVGDSPLNKDGILYLSFESDIGEIQVVTTRLAEDGTEFPTASEIAYARTEGAHTSYLNYFRLTYPGSETRFGLSSGRFVHSDDLAPHPNLLEAHISVTGEGVVRRQSGRRIDDKVISTLKKQYGANWKTKALLGGRSVLFPDRA